VSGSLNQIELLSTATNILTTRNRLRVKRLWYNGLRCGQVFHDPHDSTFEYHVIPHDRYASYLDAGSVRIDVDEAGCPVLVEVDLKCAKVRHDNDLTPPTVEYVQRHRFLDIPIQTREPRIFLNRHNGLCHIMLSRRTPVERWSFAPGAAWEIDSDSCLVGIWFGDPISDPSGCRRAAWRAGVWNAYRRGRLREISSLNARLGRGWLSLPKIFA